MVTTNLPRVKSQESRVKSQESRVKTATELIRLLLIIAFFALGSSTFATDTPTGKEPKPRRPMPVVTPPALSRSPASSRLFDTDPIRFTLSPNKRSVAVGEEIELTITAHYLNISPALLFTMPGSNAYRLKLLLPEGFVQTGGTFSDYVGAELSPGQPTITYTVRGVFGKADSRAEFRLLRSHFAADENSLFVEKARLPIRVEATEQVAALKDTKGARSSGSLAFQIVSYDCNSGVLQYQLTGGDGSPIHLSLPGITDGTVDADQTATYVFPSDGRTGRTVSGYASQSGNQTAINFTSGCSLNPTTNPNPNPTTPIVPPTPNPTPTTGGNLAFQIVSYDCNSGVLQYQVTGGDGSPIHLSLPGITDGMVNADQTATYVFPGDGRTGRTVSGYASQSGNRISINFTNGCGLNPTTNPNPNPTTPPIPSQPPTPTTPPTTGGNLVFQIVSYDCNSGQLQCKMAGGNGTPIHLSLSGLTDATVYADQPLTYGFPSDGRVGRTVNGYAYQSDFQVNISFTTSCGLNTVTNPNPNPSGGCGNGNGLTGFYANSNDLSGNLVAIRTDARIDFPWGYDSPIPGTVNADGFSVRWFGQIEAPVSGNYTFKTNNDDGTRLLDKQPITH